MKIPKIYAILHEPASYTIDRNKAVYDPMGINYCYIFSTFKENESEIRESTPLSSLSLFNLIKKLQKILKDNDIIIMNGYNGKYFQLLFILNIFYRRKIGLDSDTQLNIPSNPIKKIIKKIYLNTIFKNKNIYGLPGGSGSHKDLFLYYGMRKDKIFLMPMVVNVDKFRKKEFFKITNLKQYNNNFTFLFVGRFIPVKNIELMIKAFIKTFHHFDMVKLKLIGDGELKSVLEEKYSTYPNIIFSGSKTGQELINEYHKASAFILPSYFDQWGLVVNEAMAAGLPVIISDKVGAKHDLVDGKNTGYIFKSESLEDLMIKMKEMFNLSEIHFNQIAQNSYKLMNNFWNYEFYKTCLIKFIKA